MLHLCEEYSVRACLHHKKPYIFFQSQWQTKDGPSIVYLAYRWLLTTFLLGSLLYSVIEPSTRESLEYTVKWLIYLSHWCYTSYVIQSLICTVSLTAWLICTKRNKGVEEVDENPWFFKIYKVYWISNTIATVAAISMTALHWTLQYDSKTTEVGAEEVLVYIGNSVIMLLELCIVRHPIYVLHFYWPLALANVYCFFSIIYYAAGGTSRKGDPYIYAALDWRNIGLSVFCSVGCLLLVILFHCVCSWLSTLRIYIHMKIFPTEI